jgi:hypothetical protein
VDHTVACEHGGHVTKIRRELIRSELRTARAAAMLRVEEGEPQADVLKDIKETLAHARVRYTCPVSRCKLTYVSDDSLEKHLEEKHGLHSSDLLLAVSKATAARLEKASKPVPPRGEARTAAASSTEEDEAWGGSGVERGTAALATEATESDPSLSTASPPTRSTRPQRERRQPGWLRDAVVVQGEAGFDESTEE